MVSYFCVEIEVLGKIWENSRNYIFAEDPRSQKGGCEGCGASHSPQTPPGRGPGQAAPGSHLARWWQGWRRPFRLFTPFDLKTPEPPIVFREKIQSAAATSKPNSGTRSSCSGTLPGQGSKARLLACCWETPRGRYDAAQNKFSLDYKTKFIESSRT